MTYPLLYQIILLYAVVFALALVSVPIVVVMTDNAAAREYDRLYRK